MPTNIVAVCGPGSLGYDGKINPVVAARLTTPGAVPGYDVIASYSSWADLLAQIRKILGPRNDCLAILEVLGHGDPHYSDDISKANAAGAAGFGAALRTVVLCDNVDIYLSGCNTGVNDNAPSIAEVLSRDTPTQARDKRRVTVWGSVGYLKTSGSHAEGNPETLKELLPWAPAYPWSGDGINPGVYQGSHDAVGTACYHGFLEGARV